MIQLSSPENTEPEEEIEAPQSDDAREGLVAEIEKELGDALIATEIVPGVDVWARVTKEAWLDTARILLRHCNMKYFNFLLFRSFSFNIFTFCFVRIRKITKSIYSHII